VILGLTMIRFIVSRRLGRGRGTRLAD